MALISCFECGKEISDKAHACPNCGCPRLSSAKTVGKEEITRAVADGLHQKESDDFKTGCGCATFAALVVCIVGSILADPPTWEHRFAICLVVGGFVFMTVLAAFVKK